MEVHLIADGFKRGYREERVIHLGFLQAEQVRLGGLKPGQHMLKAGAHGVDIPAGDQHRLFPIGGDHLASGNHGSRLMQLFHRRIGLVAGVLVMSGGGLAQAQSTMSVYQTPAEQELYNTSPGKPKGSTLDVTNPFDLINRLRQATAMDDATDPSDAIDAALRGWDAQTTDPVQ